MQHRGRAGKRLANRGESRREDFFLPNGKRMNDKSARFSGNEIS
jgi:hypothetical protein